jgi:hypothetical protein
MEPAALKRRRAFRGIALDLALIVTGTLIAFWPTLRSGFDRMQADRGDSVFLNYVLEHETRALLQWEYVGTLWSPPFFHPARDVLTYSENLLGTLPVYALLRIALRPDTAYQAWCIVMLALCYIAMAWALRRLGVAAALSGLGAFVFAFGLPRAFHLNHGQLLPAAFTPLAIVALVLYAQAPDRRRFAGVLVALFFQVVAGIYLGWLLLLGIALFAILLIAIDSVLRNSQGRFLKENAAFVIVSILSWAGALFLFLRPYFDAARQLSPRPWSELLLLLPRPRSWVAAPPGSLWAKLWNVFPPDDPFGGEHTLFLGAVPCLLIVVGIFMARRSRVEGDSRRTIILASLGSVVVLGALSLRIPVKMLEISIGGERLEYVTLWRFVYNFVPGATSIRAVGRIWTVMLPLALIGGLLGLEIALGKLRSGRKRRWAVAAIVAFGVVDQFQANPWSFDKLAHREEVRSVRMALEGSACDAAYVLLDPAEPYYVSQLVAMWGGLEANVPVLNGYSGNLPKGYPNPTQSMTETELEGWLLHAPKERCCVVAPARPGVSKSLRIVESDGIGSRPASDRGR